MDKQKDLDFIDDLGTEIYKVIRYEFIKEKQVHGNWFRRARIKMEDKKVKNEIGNYTFFQFYLAYFNAMCELLNDNIIFSMNGNKKVLDSLNIEFLSFAPMETNKYNLDFTNV